MNDFDYENMQKKITARGAYHKKNGSKSRRCTFPSDHLTPAQKAALNGPVTTILLNQPMDWETYRASGVMLAQMFGVSPGVVCRELKRLNLKPAKDATDNKGADYERKWAAWEAFCNGVIGGGDDPNLVKPEANEQIEPTDDKVDGAENTVWDVDPEMLADALEEAKRLAESQPVTTDALVEPPTLNLCDPDHPDHVNARRCEDSDPVDPVPDNGAKLRRLPVMKFDNDSITFYEPVSHMSKMESELTGDSRGIAKQVAELLAMFSGKISVKLSIEVAE